MLHFILGGDRSLSAEVSVCRARPEGRYWAQSHLTTNPRTPRSFPNKPHGQHKSQTHFSGWGLSSGFIFYPHFSLHIFWILMMAAVVAGPVVKTMLAIRGLDHCINTLLLRRNENNKFIVWVLRDTIQPARWEKEINLRSQYHTTQSGLIKLIRIYIVYSGASSLTTWKGVCRLFIWVSLPWGSFRHLVLILRSYYHIRMILFSSQEVRAKY